MVKEYAAKAVDPVTGWYEHEVNFPNLETMIPAHAQTILDFGCGSGEFTHKLSQRYNTTGADMAPMVTVARQNYPELPIIEWDGGPLFPEALGSYDVIFSKLVLQFIQDLDMIASHFKKILHPTGCVIFSVPNPVKISMKFGIPPDTVTPYVDHIGDTGIETHPIYRSQATYVEIFTSAGFDLSATNEPLVPPEVLLKHSVSADYNKLSNRLNMRFVAR